MSDERFAKEASSVLIEKISEILLGGLGIVRNENDLKNSLEKLSELEKKPRNEREKNRIALAFAMLLSALERKESRGAHYREDFPEKDESFRKSGLAVFDDGKIRIEYREIPERRSE